MHRALCRKSARRRTVLFLCAAIAVIFPAGAQCASWVYLSYPDGQNILHSPEKALSPGYITLDESDGQPVFQMYAGRMTKCFEGRIPAKVEKTSQTTIITVRKDLAGCFTARFVINNDGTGGKRETFHNGQWVWDGLEHSLKPRM